MDFASAAAFLDSLHPKGMRLDLTPMRMACALMGDPQQMFPSVLVAGTNGKGSTVAFLSSIALASGLRVGATTSPHLTDVRERISINREIISCEDFADLATCIVDRLPEKDFLTYFEFITLMSFLYFAERRVDVAMVEVGMGGRLDATNVLTPLVSVITSVSLDHQQHLGETLALIAKEKCGIIKSGVPVVSAQQVPEVRDVIECIARERKAPVIWADPKCTIKYPLGLVGEHQRQNAACAIAAADVLHPQGVALTALERGLRDARWPARLERVRTNPTVIIDAAHNVAGAGTLAQYLRDHVVRDRVTLLVGMFRDKDMRGILAEMAPCAREIICTRAPTERGATPEEIAALIPEESDLIVRMADNPVEACKAALSRLREDHWLVIAGSISVSGLLREYLLRHT